MTSGNCEIAGCSKKATRIALSESKTISICTDCYNLQYKS
jgi:hypothetical protein